MIPNLKELNTKVQKPRYKEVGNWMVRHFERDAALYVTWALLHTSITAHQVTFITLCLGLLSALILALPGAGGLFAGAILLQIWYLFDHVDGQVARYRGTSSLTGVFFDYLMHYVVHSFIFLGIGVGAYFSSGGSILMLFFGFIAALFMGFLSMFYDAKWKAFYHWFQLLKIKEAQFNWPEDTQKQAPKATSSVAKRIFSLACKLTEIHVVMNIITILSIFGLWLTSFRFAEILTVFYALLLPTIFIIRTIYAVKGNTLDQEFKDLVRL
ncbi:MAG: CDP-alcohol phosphatidyltransferase family protein [Candidatus Omnitrophica bacterium]|nr:CDP-alcohol phosphatidyltransferase family protein [Candidatus Omnitrophota bacterium]